MSTGCVVGGLQWVNSLHLRRSWRSTQGKDWCCAGMRSLFQSEVDSCSSTTFFDQALRQSKLRWVSSCHLVSFVAAHRLAVGRSRLVSEEFLLRSQRAASRGIHGL